MTENSLEIEESSSSPFVDVDHKLQEAKSVCILTHRSPDPDAIASTMAIQWAIQSKYGVPVESFFEGEIDHPQNMALVNLLDPDMRPIEEFTEEYDLYILVDTVPANAGSGSRNVEFDIVFDHHKESPNGVFSGIFINLKAGSAVATVWAFIDWLGLEFEDTETDARVATAMLAGIATDTENMMSEDCSNFETQCWTFCQPHRDIEALKKIVNFERPMAWVTAQAKAIERVEIDDGLAIAGIRTADEKSIPAKHRAMIPDFADQVLKWEGVTTAIVFGIVDGSRVEGCVRSLNASIGVPKLCRALGEKKKGVGGGKLGKGAYKYELGGGGIDDEDEEADITAKLDVLCSSERKRIRRVFAQ